MKILITGGAGFIGSHIVDLFVKKGCKVAVVDDLSFGKKKNLNSKAYFFKQDVNSHSFFDLVADFKPEVILHNAALVSVPLSQKKPLKDLEINVQGTLRVLEAARNNKVKQVVFASSVAVYGNAKKLPIKETTTIKPISIYGISKGTAEFYLKTYSQYFTTTILRYANVYGPRQNANAEGGVVAIFCNKINNGQKIIIYGDGRQTRDFIYVKDVALANWKTVVKKKSGIFNISTNKATSILNLIKNLKKASKKNIFFGKTDFRLGDVRYSRLDNSKAKRFLNWRPNYQLQKGLAETLAYFQ